jgi:CRP-like cAMP-binding protein
MALINKNNIRGSSILALSHVSLAVLTAKDFNLACSLYPNFQNKMNEIAEERKKINRPSIQAEKRNTGKLINQILNIKKDNLAIKNLQIKEKRRLSKIVEEEKGDDNEEKS